ncbi:MAG: MBL fold metallo-hydrolase [Gemmatimonadaceae bacterium]|nr:MBL fold metallo-hydrolase [Gemmatimonadaceae bacterium]
MLGSGSRGNAILVDGSAGSLVVDAGFGVRTLAKRFEAASRRPEEVGALLLTHEHVDHACGATGAGRYTNGHLSRGARRVWRLSLSARLSTCRPCPGRRPEPPACLPSSRR